MKDQLRRIFALMMSVMMLCGNLPVTAIADGLASIPGSDEGIIASVPDAEDGEESADGISDMMGSDEPIVDVGVVAQPFADSGISPLANGPVWNGPWAPQTIYVYVKTEKVEPALNAILMTTKDWADLGGHGGSWLTIGIIPKDDNIQLPVEPENDLTYQKDGDNNKETEYDKHDYVIPGVSYDDLVNQYMISRDNATDKFIASGLLDYVQWDIPGKYDFGLYRTGGRGSATGFRKTETGYNFSDLHSAAQVAAEAHEDGGHSAWHLDGYLNMPIVKYNVHYMWVGPDGKAGTGDDVQITDAPFSGLKAVEKYSDTTMYNSINLKDRYLLYNLENIRTDAPRITEEAPDLTAYNYVLIDGEDEEKDFVPPLFTANEIKYDSAAVEQKKTQDIYFYYNKVYTVEHYVADLNENHGDPTPNDSNASTGEYAGYVKVDAATETRALIDPTTTYQDVHDLYINGAMPANLAFEDQYIFSPNSNNNTNLENPGTYTKFKYALGGAVVDDGSKENHVKHDANGLFLQNQGQDATGKAGAKVVQAGDVIKVYWDRILEFEVNNDNRNVTAINIASNSSVQKEITGPYKSEALGKLNNIRQSEIAYNTHYELWNDLFGAQEDIKGIIVKDAWQRVNAIDMKFTNDKSSGYIFHSVRAPQVYGVTANSDSHGRTTSVEEKKDDGKGNRIPEVITISDTEIKIDNIKGGSGRPDSEVDKGTWLYLVPTIEVKYFVDGTEVTGALDAAATISFDQSKRYTINYDPGLVAGGGYYTETNSSIGDGQTYEYTLRTIPVQNNAELKRVLVNAGYMKSTDEFRETDWYYRPYTGAAPVPRTSTYAFANTVKTSNAADATHVHNNGVMVVELHLHTLKPSWFVTKQADIEHDGGNCPDDVNQRTAHVGDTIKYTVEVTNTGDSTLDTLYLTDTFTGNHASAPTSKQGSSDWTDAGAPAVYTNDADGERITNLKPGETVTITYSYVVDKQDKRIDNVVVVDDDNNPGDDPDDDTPPESDNTSTPVDDLPDWTVVKKVAVSPSTDYDTTAQANVGNTLSYQVVVTNTGNTKLDVITLSDSLVDLSKVTVQAQASQGSSARYANSQITNLDVGESITLTYTYTVQPTDTVVNNTVTATYNNKPKDSSTSTTISSNKQFTVVKTATVSDCPGGEGHTTAATDANGNTVAHVGDTLKYTVIITNTGNVKLEQLGASDALNSKAIVWNTDVTIVSIQKGTTDVQYTVSGTSISLPDLDVNESLTITYTYTVGPNDNDLTNVVTVTEKDGTETDTTTTEVEDKPGIDVTKTVVEHNGNEVSADSAKLEEVKKDDTIKYAIVVTNTGNVTLTNIKVKDPWAKTDADADGVIATIPSLAPGASTTVYFTYTFTQEDIDRGAANSNKLVNTVTASTTYNGQDVSDSDTAEVATETNPSFTATKIIPETYDDDGNLIEDFEGYQVGDKVEFEIVVTNDGDVTLTGVQVVENLNGAVIENDKPATDQEADAEFAPKYKVEDNIAIITSIAPGESVTVYAYYIVKASDLPAVLGKALENQATVSHPDVKDPAEPNVEITRKAWEVKKTVKGMTGSPDGEGAQFARLGDTLTYTITVTNTGDKMLNNLKVVDTFQGKTLSPDALEFNDHQTGAKYEGGVISKLPAGASVTLTYTHTVGEDDLGGLTNAVVVKDPDDPMPKPEDPDNPDNPDDPEEPGDSDKYEPSAEVETDVEAWEIQKVLTKVNESETKPFYIKAGDTVEYTITLKNIGSVDLDDIDLSDALTLTKTDAATADGTVIWNTNDLREGEVITSVSVTCDEGQRTFRVTYAVQDGDAFLSNVATASKDKYPPYEPQDPDDPDGDPDDEPEPVGKDTETSKRVDDPVYVDIEVEKEWLDGDGELLDEALKTSITIKVVLTSDEDEQTFEAALPILKDDGTKVWKATIEHVPLGYKAEATTDDPNPTVIVYTITVYESNGTDQVGNNGRIKLGDHKFDVTVANIASFQYKVTNTLADDELTNDPTKEADEDAAEGVGLGDTVTYTISRTSHLANASAAKIIDTLPAGLTFDVTKANVAVTITTPSGTKQTLKNTQYTQTVDGQVVTWEIPDVPPMATVTVEYTVVVNENAILGTGTTLVNAAEFGFSDPENEYDFKDASDTVGINKPALKIEKSADVKAVTPGGELTYTLKLTNNGKSSAANVKVVDQLPPEVTVVEPLPTGIEYDDDARTITWTVAEIGTVAPANVATLSFKVKVNATPSDDSIIGHLVNEKNEFVKSFSNVATITEGAPGLDPNNPPDPDDPDDPNADKEVTNVADLLLTKVGVAGKDVADSEHAKNDRYDAGDEITYTVTVHNIGSVDLTNVIVTDNMFIDAKDDVVSIKIADGEATQVEVTGNTVVIPVLKAGETATITYVYVVTQTDLDDGDAIENTASAKGSYPTDPSNPQSPKKETNESKDTEEMPLDPDPVLELDKSVTITRDGKPTGSATAGLGDTLMYQILVVNTGNVTITGVEVDDSMFVGRAQNIQLNGEDVALTAEGKVSIGTMNVGDEAVITYTYVVTEEDILAGRVDNIATTEGDPVPNPNYDPDDPDNPDNPPSKTPGDDDDENVVTDEKNSELVITKTVDNTPAGNAFVEGELVVFKITVTNVGNVSRLGDVIDEQMPNAIFQADTHQPARFELMEGGKSARIALLEPNETVELYARYTVTQQDVINGIIDNIVIGGGGATATPNPSNTPVPTPTPDPDAPPTDPPVPTATPGAEVEVTPEPPVAKLELVKTALGALNAETGEYEPKADGYELGDVIGYTITVRNLGNIDVYEVVVEDLIPGAYLLPGDGYTIKNGNAQITMLERGGEQTVTVYAEYVVTEADILAGGVHNDATAKGTAPTPVPTAPKPTETPDPDDPDSPDPDDPTESPSPVPTIPVEPGEDDEDIDTVPKNGHLTLVKKVTNKPASEEGYALGETITYSVTIINDGNLTLTDIVVTDELTGGEWKIPSLKPGESKIFTTSYVVTEADILAGTVLNVVTAKGKSPDPEEPEVTPDPSEVESETEEKNGHLALEKTVTNRPANGSAYALGETIEYSVKVVNDGNLTITDIVVIDELTGGKWTVASLKPGESKTFTTSYVVTEADILAGTVLNVATAKGKSPDPEKPEVTPDPSEVERKTEKPNGHLTLEKTVTNKPANGTRYLRGETITYSIKVVNDGNLTITDIVVTDKLTGDEWKIPSLKPGESKTFTTSHVVTEEDILVGKVLNVATAKGKSPDPEHPDVPTTPSEVESETAKKYGHLTVTKVVTNTPAEGNAYGLGETITYEIKVLNDGNLTLTNILVTDELTGGSWVIASLEPWETRHYSTSYVVTEADVAAGRVLNVATATGKSPDPDYPNVKDDSDEVISPTKKPDGTPTFKLLKTETNLPERGYYLEGETVEYNITVTNTGSVAIIGFVLTDELNGVTILPGSGYTVKSQKEALIERLRPGQSVDVKASYKVTKEDVKRGSIRNVASGTGTGANGKKAEGNVTEVTVPTNDKTYRVTVHYYYLDDGSQAAPDQVQDGLKPSEDYDFLSPEIDGYWTLTTRVSGKTPAHDVEVSVYYVSNSVSLPGIIPEVEDMLKSGMVLVLLDEYGTPMGIGSVTRNVGDCFE